MILLKLPIFWSFVAISVAILLMILAYTFKGGENYRLDRYFADRFHVRRFRLLL